MGLEKNITLSVSDYSINLSSPIKLYRGDAIKLNFKLSQLNFEIKTEPLSGMSFTRELAIPIQPLKGTLLIENPLSQDSIESVNVVGDVISFHITEKHTNYVGVSKMQIVLEDEACCRSALPPFEFQVQEIIASYDIKAPDPSTLPKFCGLMDFKPIYELTFDSFSKYPDLRNIDIIKPVTTYNNSSYGLGMGKMIVLAFPKTFGNIISVVDAANVDISQIYPTQSITLNIPNIGRVEYLISCPTEDMIYNNSTVVKWNLE